MVQLLAVAIEQTVQRIELELSEQLLVVRVFNLYKNAVAAFELLGQECKLFADDNRLTNSEK